MTATLAAPGLSDADPTAPPVDDGHDTSLFYVVPPRQLVPDLHPGLAVFQMGEPVFATGYLVGLLEAPCMTFLHRYRARPGQTPVGTTIAITHQAPSIPGDRLQVTARCVDEDHARNRFTFTVDARNQHGQLVADGHIVQHLVERATFRTRLHRSNTMTHHDQQRPPATHQPSTSPNTADTPHDTSTGTDEKGPATTTGSLTHRLAEHGFTHPRRRPSTRGTTPAARQNDGTAT